MRDALIQLICWACQPGYFESGRVVSVSQGNVQIEAKASLYVPIHVIEGEVRTPFHGYSTEQNAQEAVDFFLSKVG